MPRRTRAKGPLPKPSPRDRDRRSRLASLCKSLPGTEIKPVGHGHASFSVAGKTFAYYLFHHHGDGIVAVCAKAAPGRQQELVSRDPRRYFVPAYLGPRGWVSLRLDGRTVDWDEVFDLVVGAYRLQAPRRLAAELS